MRKDKGLNGDLDRLPMLTWILFLKLLDDSEQLREERAKMKGERFRPAIAEPYRWRDWAAREDGITGDDLKEFINNDKTDKLDGAERPGLFAYLRSLQGEDAHDPRGAIAAVFKDVNNRMLSGHLLRDVINKVNGIHFNSSDVRFMVEVTDPRLGETVLDPACGTGGFLVEAYQHLEKQCSKAEHRRTLQQATIFGGEAKPLPFMLAQMNLLLHGLEAPQINPGNSLAVNLREIGDRDRVDVILTNPPFGGEEERRILNNFPDDKQTAETALLFMQLIMRKLRRPPKPGRAAVVVPDGFLFGEGVGARVKEELLTTFNLHTIVRLPKGVFAPYTGIQSNLLFFDRSGPTKEIWFYEMPLPAGRKNYSKTAPLQYEEFGDCLAWWKNREENDRAWRIDFAAKYKQARVEAEPHWAAAEAADAKAKELARSAKEIADEIQRLKKPEIELLKNSGESRGAEKEIERLEAKRARLLAAEAEERERAKQEQAIGDGIYWPIFNLDIKNPNSAESLEHLPPEQLADDILRKEQRIAELIAEVKQVLSSAKI